MNKNNFCQLDATYLKGLGPDPGAWEAAWLGGSGMEWRKLEMERVLASSTGWSFGLIRWNARGSAIDEVVFLSHPPRSRFAVLAMLCWY